MTTYSNVRSLHQQIKGLCKLKLLLFVVATCMQVCVLYYAV